jgi:hypothetical protein
MPSTTSQVIVGQVLSPVDYGDGNVLGLTVMSTTASTHMFADRQRFETYKSYGPADHVVQLGDGSSTPAFGGGKVRLKCKVDDDIVEIMLSEVLHVPALTCNFVSVHTLAKFAGTSAIFGAGGGNVTRNGRVVMQMTSNKYAGYILDM